jgi:hypothetical protein
LRAEASNTKPGSRSGEGTKGLMSHLKKRNGQ